MKGRSFRSPVAGFSKPKKRGRSSWIICKVRCARRSPCSRRLGLRVKTLLYLVQMGEAQIMSKWPGANLGSGSQLQMSAQMVGSALGSTSSEVTSHPSSAKALVVEPVPEKRRIVFHLGLAGQPRDCDEGGAAAGQLEVAEGRRPPTQRPRGAAHPHQRGGRGCAAGRRASGPCFGRTSFFCWRPYK